jgi:hypothetical protein
VQRLIDRADALIDSFTGGDPGLRAALERMHEQGGPERASRGLVVREAFDFVARVRAARASGQSPEE